MKRVLSLLAVLVASSGCGASKAVHAVDPVAKAADATVSLGAVQTTMKMSISAKGRTLPMTGSGVFDMKSKAGRMTMSGVVPGQGKIQIDEQMQWPRIYMSSPLFKNQLPHHAKWMMIDMERAGKTAGIDMSALANSGGNDPSDLLSWLKGAKSRKIGSETVNGTQTTHYRSTVDLIAVRKKLSPAARQSIDRIQKLTGVKTLPADVWVDGRNRVRRQRMAYSQSFTPGGPRAQVSYTIDYVKFGVPLALNIPTGNDVFDATDVAAKGLAGQTGG